MRQTPGWATIPVAFANGDGTWNITNEPAGSFIGGATWSSAPGVRLVTGDFNGNGLTDIALVPAELRVGHHPGRVRQRRRHLEHHQRAGRHLHRRRFWSSAPGVRLVAGDFNGNGLTDIALVRQTPGWSTIPVAFANGDGTWNITNEPAPSFIGGDSWSSAPGVRLVAGDFK